MPAAILLLTACSGSPNSFAPAVPANAPVHSAITITPTKASLTSTGPYLYLIQQFGLAVYSETTNSLVQSFNVGCPQNDGFIGATLSADKSKLYIASLNPGNTYVLYTLDTATNTLGSAAPLTHPVVQVGKSMWQSNYYATGTPENVPSQSDFFVTNLVSDAIVSQLGLLNPSVSLPIVDTNSGRAYYDDFLPENGTTIDVFNPSTPNSFAARYPVTGFNYQPAIDQSGKWIYFYHISGSFFGNPSLDRMNTSNGAYEAVAPDNDVIGGSALTAVTPDDRRAYVAQIAQLNVFDIVGKTELPPIPIASPRDIEVGAQSGRLYVDTGSSVAVIDPATDSVVTTMPYPSGWGSANSFELNSQ